MEKCTNDNQNSIIEINRNNESITNLLTNSHNLDESKQLIPLGQKDDEVGYVDYQKRIDQKIIEICETIYNNNNFETHKYNYMVDFLEYSIKLSEDILELIGKLSDRLNENINCHIDEEICKNIITIIDEFKNNCIKINFFEDDSNINQLNELLIILGECLKPKHYARNNFRNEGFIFSDMQMTWTLIKVNLDLYQESKFKEYQKFMFPEKKEISYNIFQAITNFFITDTNKQDLIIYENKDKKQDNVIQNEITYESKITNPNDNLENNSQKLISAI